MKHILSLIVILLSCTVVLMMDVSLSTASSSESPKPGDNSQKYPPSIKMIGMGVTCADCHGLGKKADYSSLMYEKCVSCHKPFETIAKTTEARVGSFDNVHDSPHWGRELACSNCHTVHKGTQNMCLQCHEQPAMKKMVVKPMPKAGMADDLGKYALLLLVSLLAIHAAGRCMGAKRKEENTPAERVFVFPVFVRVFHWVNAALFLIQLYTGFAIHYVGASWAMKLDRAVSVHTVAGVLLAVNFVLFLGALLLTGEIKQYVPHAQGFAIRLRTQARYYLIGMFKGEKAPFAISRENRFNPLQQIAYFVVFICGMPLLILSGLALLLASYSWITWIHLGFAVLFGLFLLLHIYLATTGKTPGSLIKGMFNGYVEKK